MHIEWLNYGGLQNYMGSLAKMEAKVNDIIAQKATSEIWLLEHEHVYTAGTNAAANEIKNIGEVPIVHPGRGGKYTYHGPGQLVVYPILDLRKLHAPNEPDLRRYIYQLEEWIIATLAEFKILGFRLDGMTGIWVKEAGSYKKIAAIGVRVRKWVSFHGIAINISPDISYYNNIIPCGISAHGVTSIQQLGFDFNKEAIISSLCSSFACVFKKE